MSGEVFRFKFTLSNWYELYKFSLLGTKLCSEGMHKKHIQMKYKTLIQKIVIQK